MSAPVATNVAQQRRRAAMMTSQYRNWFKDPSPYFIATFDEKDVNTWIVLLVNMSDQFEYGEYLFTFTAGPDFPQKPPENLCCHTPNGVFELGGKICISIGEFHGEHKPGDAGRDDLWRPSLGMMGFAKNVVNSMLAYEDLHGGIRIVRAFSPEAMKTYARQSHEYNDKKNGRLSRLTEQFIAEHKDFEPVKLMLQSRMRLATAQSYGQTGNTAQGAPANSADISTPVLIAGARNASLAFTAMTAAAAPVPMTVPSAQAGGSPLPEGVYSIPGMGSPVQAAPTQNASLASAATKGHPNAMASMSVSLPTSSRTAQIPGRAGGLGGVGTMGTSFPSAIPSTAGNIVANIPLPGSSPAGTSYAGNTTPPATYSLTVSAYQAPPPTPVSVPTPGTVEAPYSAHASRLSQAQTPSALYTHSSRHVGVSSGHSIHAQTQAASSARIDDAPNFPKVAFTPQQTLHLHNTTHTPSGLYSARVASYAEAAAAAEERAGHPLAGRSVRLAGRVDPPPPLPAPKKKTSQPPKKKASQLQPPSPVDDRESLSELLADDGGDSVTEATAPAQHSSSVISSRGAPCATKPQNTLPLPVAEATSGPLFPGGMPAATGASALAAYGLKPAAAPQHPPKAITQPNMTPAPAQAYIPAVEHGDLITAPPRVIMADRHDNVELGDPDVVDANDIVGTTANAEAQPPARTTAVEPKAKEAIEELADEIDSLLLGSDDAIAAALNAVNATFDEPPSAEPFHQSPAQEAEPVAAAEIDEESVEEPADAADAQSDETVDTLIDQLLED
jgi:ubiquitin-conjugating enzyme E2 J2